MSGEMQQVLEFKKIPIKLDIKEIEDELKRALQGGSGKEKRR